MSSDIKDAIIGGLLATFGTMAEPLWTAFAENPSSVVLIGVVILAGLLRTARHSRRCRQY
ncbi:MAG: hypothetical protein LH624_09460 [Cryobacterium sp.]|nr:hypothetical protein [Cryobacterium sp.]